MNRTAYQSVGWTVGVALWVLTAAGQAQQKATYLPHWLPQSQFAGYYVALDKGVYARHGVELTILKGGPDQPATEWLEAGQADFITTFLVNGLKKRDQGVPFVNIAQMSRRSALLLVARKSSGIATPADLNGKTVTIWPEYGIQPMALFRKFNVKPVILPQRDTLNLFLRGGADAALAMWYNEYHLLLNSGLNEDEITVFHFDEYGLNFPEDGIYCLETTLKTNPDLCRRFVQASVEGWQYAFSHPTEALDIVMKRVREAKTLTPRVHHQWMLNRMKDIMLPDGDPARMGILTESEFRAVADELRQGGIIKQIPDFKTFYENCARD